MVSIVLRSLGQKLSTIIPTALISRIFLLPDNQWTQRTFGFDSWTPIFPAFPYDWFLPTSNFFVQFSAKRGTICDTLAEFAIAISNTLATSVLKATKSSWSAQPRPWVGFQKVLRTVTCDLYRFFACILPVSLQCIRPIHNLCCWPKLFGPLVLTLPPSFLPWHFLLDWKMRLSSNQ